MSSLETYSQELKMNKKIFKNYFWIWCYVKKDRKNEFYVILSLFPKEA